MLLSDEEMICYFVMYEVVFCKVYEIMLESLEGSFYYLLFFLEEVIIFDLIE